MIVDYNCGSASEQTNLFFVFFSLSINKRNADFMPNTDETVCQGHKWGLLALWRYMSSELCINTEAIWEAIKDVVIKTIIRYIITYLHRIKQSDWSFAINSWFQRTVF